MLEIFRNTGFLDHLEELKKEEMYEKSYAGSYYKKLMYSEDLKEKDITLFKLKINNKLIGIATFEKEIHIREFRYNYIKYVNKELGYIMIYIKEEYRKKGYAKELMLAVQKYLETEEIKEEDKDKIINVIAYDLCKKLCRKYFNKIYTITVRDKSSIIEGIRFNGLKTYKEDCYLNYYE